MVTRIYPILLFCLLGLLACQKRDPIADLFKEAEALEADIIRGYDSIARCRTSYEQILLEAPASPLAPVACFKLGKLNELFGHPEMALSYYRELAATYPQHALCAEGLYQMARIYQFRLSNPEQALKTYQQLIRFYPASPFKIQAYLEQAQLYLAQGEIERAAVKFEQIITEFPGHALGDDVSFRLGDLFEKQLQRPEQAQKWYQKVVDNYPTSSWANSARSRLASLAKGVHDEEK